MTKRKICVEVGGKWEYVGGWIPDKWVPLDPQPCCENCKFLEQNKSEYWDYFQCSEILKTVESGNDHASTAYEIKNLKFYCLYWRLKE